MTYVSILSRTHLSLSEQQTGSKLDLVFMYTYPTSSETQSSRPNLPQNQASSSQCLNSHQKRGDLAQFRVAFLALVLDVLLWRSFCCFFWSGVLVYYAGAD